MERIREERPGEHVFPWVGEAENLSAISTNRNIRKHYNYFKRHENLLKWTILTTNRSNMSLLMTGYYNETVSHKQNQQITNSEEAVKSRLVTHLLAFVSELHCSH